MFSLTTRLEKEMSSRDSARNTILEMMALSLTKKETSSLKTVSKDLKKS